MAQSRTASRPYPINKQYVAFWVAAGYRRLRRRAQRGRRRIAGATLGRDEERVAARATGARC